MSVIVTLDAYYCYSFFFFLLEPQEGIVDVGNDNNFSEINHFFFSVHLVVRIVTLIQPILPPRAGIHVDEYLAGDDITNYERESRESEKSPELIV